MIAGSNIDDVRARIMELEAAEYFDGDAWQRALADLRAAGRVAGLADAERRMETARANKLELAPPVVLHVKLVDVPLLPAPVAVETV